MHVYGGVVALTGRTDINPQAMNAEVFVLLCVFFFYYRLSNFLLKNRLHGFFYRYI
jgi:hypothetical protein